jgi:hypothetical protein
MRLWKSFGLALCLGALGVAVFDLQAQDAQQVETLKRQLEQMQENLNRIVREQQAQIDALKGQIEAMKTNAAPGQASVPPPAQPSQPVTGAGAGGATTPGTWSPTQPIRVGSAQAYLNISFDALVAAGGSTANDINRLETGGHDPTQNGFTVQNLETVFEGKVDPYFRGQANIVLQIGPDGQTTIEAEEAYLETLSLPLNLQVKAGQFFTEFGRLNTSHPHTWDFVDQPLVNGRFLGPDGLRSAGARISWLAPTPFYSELFMTVANSQGTTAFSFENDHEGQPFFGRPAVPQSADSLSDLLFVPRYAASFNLSDAQTLLIGGSAALAPNSSGTDANTQIYGVDLFYKWKSPRQHAGFPFVTWQTEAMMRRFEAAAYSGTAVTPGLPQETLYDYGIYSQVAYGFKKGWVAALRGDYLFPGNTGIYETLTGPDPDRAARWRISPNLTFYPSEFSKLRLQYNLDHRDGIGYDHSVWMQFEFLLGTHAAHKF